jgi:DNA-binding SARP family transcriptional activator
MRKKKRLEKLSKAINLCASMKMLFFTEISILPKPEFCSLNSKNAIEKKEKLARQTVKSKNG